MTPAEVPPAYIRHVAQVESGGNDRADAPTSTALGRYQFIDSTWNWLRTTFPQLKLTPGGRTDPVQAERAMRQFTALNGQALANRLGRPARPSELYLAHFLGRAVAEKILLADPTGPCLPVVGAHVVRANPFIKGMTCGDLRAWARRKVPDELDGRGLPPLIAPPPKAATAEDLNAAQLRALRGDAP